MSDESKLEIRRKEIKSRGFSVDELIEALANAEILCEETYEFTMGLISAQEDLLQELRKKTLHEIDKAKNEVNNRASVIVDLGRDLAQEHFRLGSKIGVSEFKSKKARALANKRHSKIGGARDKRERALMFWASGEFATKTECTEKCHNKIPVSYETMKNKYLRGAPDPNPWPARGKAKHTGNE